jgi:hypothetical protein
LGIRGSLGCTFSFLSLSLLSVCFSARCIASFFFSQHCCLRIFQSKIYSYKIECACAASQQLQKREAKKADKSKGEGGGKSERELGREEEQAKHTASTNRTEESAVMVERVLFCEI